LLSPRLRVFRRRARRRRRQFPLSILGNRRLFRRIADHLNLVRGWPKAVARAVCSPHHHHACLAQARSSGDFGPYRRDNDDGVLPPLLLGTWIGWQLGNDDRRFRQALAVLLIISGLTLVL
jgi:hypothetical protein